MRKADTQRKVVIALSLSVSLLALATSVSLAAFATTLKTKETDNSGKVGILSYFHCGTGTSSDPFVITRPRHLYNLAKLQNIGAFSQGSYYFQIGLALGNDSSKYYVYDSDSSSTYGSVLDMKDYLASAGDSYTIHSIGSHAYPFRSTLVGNDMVVKNLHVLAEPDDVGLFGYVSYEGSITHFVMDSCSVSSDGYKKSLSGVYVPSPAFDDAATYNMPASPTPTEKPFTTSDQFDNSETRSELASVAVTALSDSTFGTISLHLPTNVPTASSSEGGTTTYTVQSSTPLLSVSQENATTYTATIQASLLKTTDYSTFWDTEKNILISRLYVLANNTLDSIPVSRTISSYEIYVENVSTNAATGTHEIALGFVKDYYDGTSADYTQYHHNNNIGIAIGHLDGKAESIYAYNCSVQVNDSESSHNGAAFESTYGLVGEAGEHVANGMNPDQTQEGAVGYLYPDEIYDRIRTDLTTTSFSAEGTTDGLGHYRVSGKGSGSQNFHYLYQFTSSDADKTAAEEGSLYKNVSKTTTAGSPITGAASDYYGGVDDLHPNSIVFHGLKIIKGRSDDKTTTYNNGLGIFSLVTTNSGGADFKEFEANKSYPSYEANNAIDTLDVGANVASSSHKCRLLYVASEVKDPSEQTDVNWYPFSNFTSNEYRGDPTPAWPRSYGTSNETPTSADYDAKSKQSRVYLYEMPLNSDPNAVDRYFHNPKYSYLQASLEDTLVNAKNESLTPSDALFGITLRKRDMTSGAEADIDTLKRSWNVCGRGRIEFYDYLFQNKISWNNVSQNIVYGNDGLGVSPYDTTKRFYPFGEVAFSLNRTCNVTVAYAYSNKSGFASASAGSGYSPYLTISRVDLSIQNPYGGTRFPYAAVPIPNTDEFKSLYYYPSTPTVSADNAGHYDSQAPLLWSSTDDGLPLFIHTFKLEKGDYFISTNVKSAYLPICYVAVEGQQEGRLSGDSKFTLTADSLNDVDFLVTTPSSDKNILVYTDAEKEKWYARNRAKCEGSILFSNTAGSVTFTSTTVVIDEAETAVFAIAFSKTAGVTYVGITNYGETDTTTGFRRKYVVLTDSSLQPYSSVPSQNVLTSWTQ